MKDELEISANHQKEKIQNIANNIQELSTGRKTDLADSGKISELVKDNSINITRIVELANEHEKNIEVSTINAASIIDLMEFNKKAEAENKINFDSLRKGQEDILQMITALVKNTSFPPTNKEVDNIEIVQLKNDDKATFPPTAVLVETMNDMGTSFMTVPNSELNITETEMKSQSTNLVEQHNINASKASQLVFSGPATENPDMEIQEINPTDNTKDMVESPEEENYEAQVEEETEAQIEVKPEAQVEIKLEAQNEVVKQSRTQRSKLRRRMRYKNYSPPSPKLAPHDPKEISKTPNPQPSLASNLTALFKSILTNSPNIFWGVLLIFALQISQS